MVVKHASLHTGVPSAAPAPLAGARGIGASGERDEMDDSIETRRTGKAGALLRALRPAVPAVISAAAMIFLFRSEEHTSELQSLMRISYAVFCLKKKKTNILKIR